MQPSSTFVARHVVVLSEGGSDARTLTDEANVAQQHMLDALSAPGLVAARRRSSMLRRGSGWWTSCRNSDAPVAPPHWSSPTACASSTEQTVSLRSRAANFAYPCTSAAFMKRPGGWPVCRLKAVLNVLAEP